MATSLKVNNNEIVENKVDIENALSRMRRPLDVTSINVEVYGVYSLPDQWKSKIDDPSEQLYQYELEAFGMTIRNAKAFPRELTEEEKAEIEAAAKNVKGKQPPPNNAKGKKEEEPSKEEVERIEREKREKEERERKAKEEWDALDEDTKFYRKSEDIFKEPCVKFHNVYAVKRIEQLQQQLAQIPKENDYERKDIQDQIQSLNSQIYVGNAISEKQAYELIEFEEFVSQDKGCWIKFNKLPPPEEEILDPKAAAAAKKAPPKGGKGAVVEDIKPFFGKAWLNLEDLLQPGAIEIKQRIPLQTCPPLVKRMGDDGVERWVPAEEFDQVFETNQTYLYIKVTLTEAVTPTIPDQQEPLPHEVVPVKDILHWPFSKIPTDDFKMQITLAAESLALEYYKLFKNELETEARANKSEHEAESVLNFEERKKEFQYELNISGKYHYLKEKLKKTIVRIVREHFKKTGSIKGLYKDERDHFYSQLYAYLVQQMRETVQALVQKTRNELHENVTIPQEQFVKERDHLIEEDTQEQLQERYLRLASEYENLYYQNNEAEQFMLKYIAPHEGKPEYLYKMGQFYLRVGKFEKADENLRDAYSFSFKRKDSQQAFIYACFLLKQNRNKESIVILNKLAKDHWDDVKVYLLLSIAYEQDSDPLISQKFKAMAMITRLRELNKVAEAGQQYDSPPQSLPPVKLQQGQLQVLMEQWQLQAQSNKMEGAPAYNNHRLSQEQVDELYLELADLLVNLYLPTLAQKFIANVQNQGVQFQRILGQIQIQRKNYEEAIQAYTYLLDKDPNDIVAQSNIGHCYFFLKRPEAEEAYLKALRINNFSEQGLEDQYVLQRLGTYYVRNKQMDEAYQIFFECIQRYSNSFSHFNAGLASLLSSDIFRNPDKAYLLFIQANKLDPYRADIWGYAALSCFKRYSYQPSLAVTEAFQCMKEAFKLKILNVECLLDLSKQWKVLETYEYAQECIEHTLRARALKDNMRHQKKLEEFFKLVKGITKAEEIKAKFKETLVKSNCLKEDDGIIEEYIQLSSSINTLI